MSTNENLFAPKFNIKDVNVHKKERIFQRYFAMDGYQVSYKKFDGSETRIFDREIFERDHDAIAVLPYDPVTDEVLLIEQFRPGALRDPISPWLIEIVAGMIDDGETPEQAAVREVKEETGLCITQKDLELVTAQYPSPGGCSEKVTIYIARVSLADTATHGGLDVEGEDIRVFKAKASDAFAQCGANGYIKNAAALIALLTLQIRHNDLKK